MVVTRIGTRLRSARALASRSTPKFCSGGVKISNFSSLGNDQGYTFNGTIVVLVCLDLRYESTCAVVL